MIPSQPVGVNKNSRRRDLLLILFFSLGMAAFLVRGLILTFQALVGKDLLDIPPVAPQLLDAIGMLFCAALLLPGLILSIRRMRGKEIPLSRVEGIKPWQGLVLFISWIVALGLNAWLNSIPAYGWALAAPFFLLGISLPILGLGWTAVGGLAAGSRRRLWSVFGFGMTGSTLIAVLVEYLLAGIGVLLVGLLAISNPALQTLIVQIKSQVLNANTMDVQGLLTTLAPYLTNPLVMAAVLLFAVLLTPMVEEAAKPAVIWLLGKRLRSPAEGFVLGALCGAGFALLEGLMSASGIIQMAGFSLGGRAAASLMHITASGLVGWGIASAQLNRQVGRLIMAFLLAAGLHGLWNGAVFVTVFGGLRMVVSNDTTDIVALLSILIGASTLLLELGIILVGLPLINRQLRPKPAPPAGLAQSDIIPPL